MPTSSDSAIRSDSILVLGASGYIGTSLCAALAHTTKLQFDGQDETDCDLIADIPHRLTRASIVINCAGLPDEDRAETDTVYRERMWKLNALIPGRLRAAFSGYFVHISTPFVFWPELSEYARAKWVADAKLGMMKGPTLRIYPGWLYGGPKSKQIDSILRGLQGKAATIDNKRLANPTAIGFFCDALMRLVNDLAVGRWAIYEPGIATAQEFALAMGIWSPEWTAGEYQGDASKRPEDSSLQQLGDRVNHYTEHTEHGCSRSFHKL